MFRRFALLLIAPLIAGAVTQPAPTISGVYNAGSFRSPGMSAAGIAQGSIFTLFGSNLGPATCNQAFGFPVPTNVCGVSLTVTVNGTSVSPPILGVFYADQINAILPSLTPTGDNGTITVAYNNQTSATFPIQVVTSAFGEFTPAEAVGQASVTDVNYNLNTIIHTLHPGDIGILWGTGLGPISGSDAVSPPFGNVGSPTVYVGNTAVTPSSGLLYAGRSGSWPGLDQINFTVPPGVQGCYVPIAVQAGGVVGNIGTIAVAPAGQNTCSDSVLGQTLINKLAAGGNVNFGYIRLESRVAGFSNAIEAGKANDGDVAWATFSGFTPQTAYNAEYGVSSGYCVTSEYNAPADMSIAQLDAGVGLTLQGPLVSPGPLAPSSPGSGFYYIFLGSSGKYIYSVEPYTMIGTGGANVGAFSAHDTTSLPGVELSGINVNQAIPRTSDLTVQWAGGNPALQNGQVTIGAYSYSSDFTQGAELRCTAPLAAGKFVIPAWVLSTMPVTGMAQSGSLTYPLGELWIGQYNNPTPFTVPGLDGGIMTDIFFLGRLLTFD